ncbi:Holliday junction branch migration DNA helicase RuvB [Mycoplasma phocimorsus]|uniref:Holliday junction branch migration DNA helicase RuvB n=1 Tax=Mycoplasma phocimorsus TaxID=3045839 RepID=UPI0024BF662A|nr:Holliday junction branch migration DNA helicase RuvB [Mycoplasma phocimorsus]MDJ1647319.1 Holliday junction branch migration DNA helicase RuvB [Mycoplasma phocimorsus]MDJ1648951.1 Holliday junction branch migration DNA helicase RuvB [Mycoplasma phocimorsus]
MLKITNFDSYIGQNNIKKTINMMIKSSEIQNKTLDHILICGLAGTGKTTLAKIIGNMQNKKTHFAQGSLLEKKSDIVTLFSNIQEGDIIFIDEIHSINKNVEELLYTIMEEFKIDVMLGSGTNSKIIRIKVKPFTLIGATTKVYNLSNPLKERFGFIAKMQAYTLENIKDIIKMHAYNLQQNVTENVLEFIAQFSRLNPRIIINLFNRIVDFSIVKSQNEITIDLVKKALKTMGIHKYGFSEEHIEYLKCFKDFGNSRFMSLDFISGITNFNKEDILSEIEPILLSYNLIQKTSKGRKITQLGERYLLECNNY